MPIIRSFNNSENSVNYIGTVAFFCAIACVITMLRFLGFKASLNLGSGKTSGAGHYENTSGVSLTGAYRMNKDDLFGSVNYPNPPRRITPSMVKLPSRHSGPPITASKSSSHLAQTSNEIVNVRKSAPDLSRQTNNHLTKEQIKEQKRLEKQHIAEQKKQEKLAAKEREREQKIRKEREREEKIRKEREKQKQPVKTAHHKSKTQKRTAPQPQAQPTQRNVPQNSSHLHRTQHSTNTLESSISRSSGPPPYSNVPELNPNESDGTGNTSFSKPIDDTGSWDIITQHRQQMSRQAGVSKNIPKQTHLDLHYDVGGSGANRSSEKGNSDV